MPVRTDCNVVYGSSSGFVLACFRQPLGALVSSSHIKDDCTVALPATGVFRFDRKSVRRQLTICARTAGSQHSSLKAGPVRAVSQLEWQASLQVESGQSGQSHATSTASASATGQPPFTFPEKRLLSDPVTERPCYQ